ncbi:MAG: hypothetical protein V1747_03565 [Candidatus Omnitrophota bacterium]
MDIKSTLEHMRCLVGSMLHDSSCDNYRICTEIKTLSEDLKQKAKQEDMGNAYMSEKFGNLIWSVEAIAGLNDGNGHSSQLHRSWAYAALDALKGYHCFKV